MTDGAHQDDGAPGPAGSADGTTPDAMPDPRTLTIVNRKGLHARASAKVVETVGRFDAAVLVEKDDEEVSATDLLGLLMLAASCGSTVTISAAGPEAVAALDALERLIANGFGEDQG